MSGFRPMKGEPADLGQLVFPYLATPKFDGIRCVVRGGQALTSALKPQPNTYVRAVLERPEYEGFDGELIVGPHDAEVFRRTTSELRREDGEPDFVMHVFDLHDHPGTAEQRLVAMIQRFDQGHPPHTQMVLPRVLPDRIALDAAMSTALTMGYEGLMLRDPQSPYKHGKATVKQNWLLKYKPFEDCEVEVLDQIEAMENTNAKVLNERGLAQRSSHKAGKVAKGTMGALVVRVLNGRYKGVVCEVGTGFSAAARAELFAMGPAARGLVGVVRYDLAGGYDRPRFPSWKGLRMPEDIAP